MKTFKGYHDACQQIHGELDDLHNKISKLEDQGATVSQSDRKRLHELQQAAKGCFVKVGS